MAQNDIERYLWGIAPAMSLEEFEKAITAYKDKAVEEVLDRLTKEQEDLFWWTGGEYEKTKGIDMRAIQAERNRLKGEK